MKPIARHFRVYPEPRRYKRRLYYKVFIFRDRSLMHEFDREVCKRLAIDRHHAGRYEAQARWYRGLPGDRLPNQIGHIEFYLDSAARGGIVAHEMFHAALYYWVCQLNRDIREIVRSKAAEERFAHILGNLVAAYWRGWYRVVQRRTWRKPRTRLR